MTRLEQYLNDPALADEPLPLREIHAIRLMITDDTKNLSANEIRAYYQAALDQAKQRFKFKYAENQMKEPRRPRAKRRRPS